MDQAVHPVEVDEGAEVDDVRDLCPRRRRPAEAVEDLLARPPCAPPRAPRGARGRRCCAQRFSSITLQRSSWPRNSSRSCTRRMSTSEAGRKPRTPRSRIRPPLTTSITRPSTGSPDSAARLDALPGDLEAGALLREDQATLGVLLGQHERVDLVAERDLVGRIDRAADRELADRDDAFRLVTDIDEHLVLVDPDNRAVDDLPLLEGDDRRSVVGNDMAVDLEQQAVGPLDGSPLGCRGRRGGQCVGGNTAAN